MNWVSEPQDMEMIFCTFSNKMIADTKNIEYGIYYRSAEKYVRFFMDEYRRAVEAL
jgi:hypothetical protein